MTTGELIAAPVPEWMGVIPSGYALARGLEPGFCGHGLSDGSWSLIQALRGCLEKTDPADLVLATWTAARADLAEAEQFLSDGRLRSLRLIVDRSFQTRQPDYCAAARRLFGDHSIRVGSMHAKFATITGGDLDVLLLTSANLNTNRRLENYTLICGGDAPRQYASMAQRLFDLQPPASGFDRPARARHDTADVLAEIARRP